LGKPDPVSLLQRLWRRLAGRGGAHEPGLPAGNVVPTGVAACAACRFFRDDPADIEAALPGFSSLSSGYASVRGQDGLCLKHDRFVTARSCCPAFRRVAF
jgi:hypothetical protein